MAAQRISARRATWSQAVRQGRAAFGLRVSVKPTRTGRGTLTIDFASPEEAESILDRLNRS